METLARTLIAWRRPVLALLAVATLAALVSSGWAARGGIGRLVDFEPQKIFASSGPEFRRMEAHQRLFGRGDTLIVALIDGPDAFSAPVLGRLAGWTSALAAVPGVVRVESLATVRVVEPPFRLAPVIEPGPIDAAGAAQIAAKARAEPLLVGRMVSRDGAGHGILISVDPLRRGTDVLAPLVDRIRATTAGFELPVGTTIALAGIPLARVEVVRRIVRSQVWTTPVAALIFAAVLLWLFGAPRAVLLPLLAVWVAIVWTYGILFASGGRIDVINHVLPTLIFVIAISDAIHLMERYRHETAGGAGAHEALATTQWRLASACFLTSFTTAVGFGSLAVAQLDILRWFGIYAAVGVLCGYVAVVLLVPLALAYRPPLPAPRRVAAGRRGALQRIADLPLRHPRAVLALGLLLMLGLVAVALRVEVDNRLMESFHDDDPVQVDNRRVERALGGVVPFDLQLRWPAGFDPHRVDYLAALAEAQRRMMARPGLAGGLSRVDLLREASHATGRGRTLPLRRAQAAAQTAFLAGLPGGRELLAGVYREDARTERIAGRIEDLGGKHVAPLITALEAELAPLFAGFAGLEVTITADGPVAYRAINGLISDLARSLALAFVVIALFMTVLLRSVRLALISMIPNVFPLVVTFGVLGLLGWDLRIGSVIVFSVSLGLAVDDTIHFLVRYREERGRGAGVEDAIRATFEGAGRAIVATSLLLALGFGVVLFSDFPIAAHFALLLEITLAAALVGDLLLLPALLVLFGERD